MLPVVLKPEAGVGLLEIDPRGLDVSSETQRHEHPLELRPGCPGFPDRLRITKLSNNTRYGGGEG